MAGRSKRRSRDRDRWTRRDRVAFGLSLAAAVGGLGLALVAVGTRSLWIAGLIGLLIGLANSREAWRIWSRHRRAA